MRKALIITASIVLAVILFSVQFRYASRPVNDNDEGIYLTTFKLVGRGHPIYKETFFSQPPGFLAAVYPGFSAFGENLQSARLSVSLWSIAGLAAVIWSGAALGSVSVGFMAAGLLFLMPVYFNQSATFQSDAVVAAMAAITFAFMLSYLNKGKWPALILAAGFYAFAFLTKFEVTLIPVFIPFLYETVFRKLDKNSLIKLVLMVAAFLAVSAALTIPFGLADFYADAVTLRIKSITDRGEPFMLMDLIGRDPVLSAALASLPFLIIFVRKRIDLRGILVVFWSVSSFVFFFFYRPLFLHHLAMLSVPVALTVSYLVFLLARSYGRIFTIAAAALVIIMLSSRISNAKKIGEDMVGGDEDTAIIFLKAETAKNDFVISDEGIITALADRLPPPELSDISNVRISSGSITPEKYRSIISTYRPKAVVYWNGRLARLGEPADYLPGYLQIRIADGKSIYIVSD